MKRSVKSSFGISQHIISNAIFFARRFLRGVRIILCAIIASTHASRCTERLCLVKSFAFRQLSSIFTSLHIFATKINIMPSMQIKSLFKRKRRNKSSFGGHELSDDYNPAMEESEHAAQVSAEHSTMLDTKESSRSRFEAAKRMFDPISEPKPQESREVRLQPRVPQAAETRREGSTSMHKTFPSSLTKVDVKTTEAPKELPRASPRKDKKDNFDGFWKERTSLQHQRVAWTGSVVGSKQNSAGFGKVQAQDDFSAHSKSSSFLQDDEDTAQYDDIDSKDYIIESDNESIEDDGPPPSNHNRQASDDFVNFGNSFFHDEGISKQEARVFTQPAHQDKPHQRKATVKAPQRQEVQPRSDKVTMTTRHRQVKPISDKATARSPQRQGVQPKSDNPAALTAAPSMDSYLSRGTESGSVLLGEHLAPSASEDEDSSPSEHMSMNNSLLDNSLIDEPSARSSQPDGRTDYAPSKLQKEFVKTQKEFVKTVRHGWNYLEHTLAVDQNGLPLPKPDFTKTVQTVREGWSYLENNLSPKATDPESRTEGELTKTVREGLSYLENSLEQSFSMKSQHSEFDEMMTTFVQSWSYMTDDDQQSRNHVDQQLTSRQDELLNTVINNMSFFNDDSTAEEREPSLLEPPSAPKDPDEILDDILENWSLTSDNPTVPNEQALVHEEQKAEPESKPKSTNENAFIATVRQTLSYLTDDDDDKEDRNEESNKEPASTTENGFMATLRQTLSYVTDNDDEEGDDNSEDVKTRRTKRHAEKTPVGIITSWSFRSEHSRNDGDSASASDNSSIDSASDAKYRYTDEMYGDEDSEGPSDEGEDGLSVVSGGISVGEGGVLDQVLDHWTYFAKVAGIPEDFDGYDTVDSDATPVDDERAKRRGKKSSTKKRRGKKSPKSRGRKRNSSRKQRPSIPKHVFGSGDDNESSDSERESPSSGIVVDIPMLPMIAHTTEQVNGRLMTEETKDKVARGSQESENPAAEEKVSSGPQEEGSKTKPFDEESVEIKNEEEDASEETADADLVAIVTQTTAHDDAEGGDSPQREEIPAIEQGNETFGTDGVTGPEKDEEIIESLGFVTAAENGSVQSLQDADDGEYGKMKTDEESIESLGCATATEDVSVQSIQDADDDASEVFDADDLSEAGMADLDDVKKEDIDGESAESVETASESSESVHDEGSCSTESDNCSDYGSEYSDEYSDESSSVGPIKRSYSASSMKSAAKERFGQPDDSNDTDINTVAKVKSTKGQNGRVVDCQRSSKHSRRSRKKRGDEESEATQPHRRRLV